MAAPLSLLKTGVFAAAAVALMGAAPYTAPKQANGLPDWGGVWKKLGPNSWDPKVPNDQYQSDAPLNPKAKADYEAYRKAVADGKPRGDIGCLPEGMPRIARAPYPIEVTSTPKQTWIMAEFKSEVRRVYTDGRKAPTGADLEHSYEGYSTGHWEGDALVFDTVGLKEGTIDSRGLVHSDQMTVHERMRRVSPTILEDQITLTDPTVFTRPWTVTRQYELQPTWEIKEFVCQENDRNPIDANGVTGVK